ncbi:small acid-soluble spore protein K [Scopulibacillus darangshiensis]|uniref:Small acid-soluble spore protein K n=1 Tax=Scopulibacillus darangshiensis TaxID=442528 RepID=A0A4R2NKT9_9BACL|nr:small acid-soluble spore protein K [Scopulibacillus darangshiensis]TCP22130.1 small acid-soluble spore protein K [Scopulibacillus darangshiensis]
MVDREEKQYSVQNENSIQPRAKVEFSSKRTNGTTKDHPGERMSLSNQVRNDHED